MKFGSFKNTALAAKALAKAGVQERSLDEMSKYYGGPSFGHISQEYLFTSNVFPLGTITQLFGIEGCCKSTLALSLLNQLFISLGATGRLIDTENKISTPLLKSILDADSDDRFAIIRATTQEKTQAVMTALAKEVNKQTFGKKKDDPVMMGIVLDSFRVASETTQEKVIADGHATKNYAVEANLWRQFLSSYISMLEFAPLSIIVVNHLVEKQSTMGYGTVKDVGGGMAVKFLETYRVLVTKVAATTNKKEVFTDLSLQTYKNSNGIAKRKIYPRVIYQSPDIPEGKTVVDWSIADQKLLTGPDIPREALKKAGVCNVKESSTAGLFSDDVLGLEKVPFDKIVEVLYSDPERLAELRKQLGIQTFKTLDELVDGGWFYDAHQSTGDEE